MRVISLGNLVSFRPVRNHVLWPPHTDAHMDTRNCMGAHKRTQSNKMNKLFTGPGHKSKTPDWTHCSLYHKEKQKVWSNQSSLGKTISFQPALFKDNTELCRRNRAPSTGDNQAKSSHHVAGILHGQEEAGLGDGPTSLYL